MSLANLMQEAVLLENDYYDEGVELWEGSAFAWIREYKPATVGAIGRRLARKVFEMAGLEVGRSGRYLSVGHHTIAVKFSMEWTAGGFVFEQIKNTNYKYLFCLGVRPEAAFCWLIPKTELIVNGTWQTREGLTGQHTGAGGQETAWLQVDPGTPPAWLQEFGGTVDFCESVIASNLGS